MNYFSDATLFDIDDGPFRMFDIDDGPFRTAFTRGRATADLQNSSRGGK
jgi:hypothetical protein